MNITPISLLTCITITCPPILVADESPLPVVWSITEGIEAPESACLDPGTGHLFLSQIGKGGAHATLATLPQGTADHAFLPDRNLLILPRMIENTVSAFTVKIR